MASTTPIEQSLQVLCDLRDVHLREQQNQLTSALNWLHDYKTSAIASINRRFDALDRRAEALVKAVNLSNDQVRVKKRHIHPSPVRQSKSRSSSIDSGSSVFFTPPTSQRSTPQPPDQAQDKDSNSDIVQDTSESDHPVTSPSPHKSHAKSPLQAVTCDTPGRPTITPSQEESEGLTETSKAALVESDKTDHATVENLKPTSTSPLTRPSTTISRSSDEALAPENVLSSSKSSPPGISPSQITEQTNEESESTASPVPQKEQILQLTEASHSSTPSVSTETQSLTSHAGERRSLRLSKKRSCSPPPAKQEQSKKLRSVVDVPPSPVCSDSRGENVSASISPTAHPEVDNENTQTASESTESIQKKQNSPLKPAKSPTAPGKFMVDSRGRLDPAGISALFDAPKRTVPTTDARKVPEPERHSRETVLPLKTSKPELSKKFKSTKKTLKNTPGVKTPLRKTILESEARGLVRQSRVGTPEESREQKTPQPKSENVPIPVEKESMWQRCNSKAPNATERFKAWWESTGGAAEAQAGSSSNLAIPKTVGVLKRPLMASTSSKQPMSELRERIQRIRAESVSSGKPLEHPTNTGSSSTASIVDAPQPRVSILSSRIEQNEKPTRPRNSVRFAGVQQDDQQSSSSGHPISKEEPSLVPPPKNISSLIVPRTRSSLALSSDGSAKPADSVTSELSGPSNLMTSLTSFLPVGASNILGRRKPEERSEEEEAELEQKRQKLDAERREAELLARREAQRLQKQREMQDKKKRAEAKRRELEEAERAREEQRRQRDEQRRLRRQREEEERRKRKEDEDRRREERRRMVIEKKKQEERAEMERQQAAARKLVKGQASISRAGKSTRDGMPPPPPRAPKPEEVTSYRMTPAKETKLEESDEESQRRRGKPIPRWAKTPTLMESLHEQPDPDAFFTHAPVINLGEVFGGERRYRTRSSSANWVRDRATAQEMRAYRQIMDEIRDDDDDQDEDNAL